MREGKIFETLLKIAAEKEIEIKFVPFKANYGRIKGNRIGLSNKMSIEEINFNLAHELAHALLHYNKGDILGTPLNERKKCEKEADEVAELLLNTVQKMIA